MPNLSVQTISQKVLSILQLAVRKVGETLGWSQRLGEYPMGGGETIAFSNDRSINIAETTYVTAGGVSESASDITVSFWIYVDTLSGTTCTILETSGSYFHAWFENSDDTIHVKFFRNAIQELELKKSITLDAWHHVCAVYSSGTSSKRDLYIDGAGGATVVSDTGPAALNASGADTLSFSPDAAPNELQGHVDEISIFTASMTPAEVSSLYNSGTPADLLSHDQKSALAHWWRMGDGFGTTAVRLTSESPASPLRDAIRGLDFTGLGGIFTTNTP